MFNFYSSQKWVKAFKFGLLEVVVNTNNGVERKNREFKYDFLKQYKDNTLSGMVTVLVEQFIPDTYSRLRFNISCFYNYNSVFTFFRTCIINMYRFSL